MRMGACSDRQAGGRFRVAGAVELAQVADVQVDFVLNCTSPGNCRLGRFCTFDIAYVYGPISQYSMPCCSPCSASHSRR